MSETDREFGHGRAACAAQTASQDDRLRKATERGGKSYRFDRQHPRRLPIEFWFQLSDEGLILFVVFFTRACRWSLCSACNLPSQSSEDHIPYVDIVAQIDHVFAAPEVAARKQEINKVIISNNGSILDEETFPSTALMYLLAKINLELPALRTVSIETRPEYVDIEELEFMSRAMQEREDPAEIELAIGFEAFDDHVRNDVFLKGLTLAGFEELLGKVARPHLHLKCYFMQKPIDDMSDEAAIDDIRRGIDYLSELAERYDIPINMHLNPTFVARGTPLERAFREGRYRPPFLRDVVTSVLHSEGKPISVFVGLNDEGLAVEGGSFIRDGDEPVIERLHAFNRSQDYDVLAASFAEDLSTTRR